MSNTSKGSISPGGGNTSKGSISPGTGNQVEDNSTIGIKETVKPLGISDVLNWIRGYPNKIDEMKSQRTAQISRRELSLERVRQFEGKCPNEINEYYRHNISFGLTQQKELLSSSITTFYNVSKGHLDMTNKVYDNLEAQLSQLEKYKKVNCKCFFDIIEFERALLKKS